MASKINELLESFKQRLKVDENEDFRPTPSIQNDAMLGEVENFAKNLRIYRDAVRKYSQELDGFLLAYPNTARRNLPRVWDTVERAGLCEPIRHSLSLDHPVSIGGDYDEGKLEESRKVAQHRFYAICNHADRWLAGLKNAKARMQRLRSERLLVDARRRVLSRKLRRLKGIDTSLVKRQIRSDPSPNPEDRHSAPLTGPSTEDQHTRALVHQQTVGQQVSHPRASAGANEDMPIQKADLARHILQEQRKLDAIMTSYREQEQLIYDQLKSLAIDSAKFKSSVVATLLIVKEACQGTLYAFGPCKLPLPGFDASRCGGENGEVGTIERLIQDVPPIPQALGDLGMEEEQAQPPQQQLEQGQVEEEEEQAEDFAATMPWAAPQDVAGFAPVQVEDVGDAEEAEEVEDLIPPAAQRGPAMQVEEAENLVPPPAERVAPAPQSGPAAERAAAAAAAAAGKVADKMREIAAAEECEAEQETTFRDLPVRS